MAFMKHVNIATLLVVTLILCGTTASSALALSQKQEDAIVQDCDNIKQSLVKLQHSDSRTRTYLGSAYEAISGRFITPLNLRLVKNGLASTELFRIQNDFIAAQNHFRTRYVEYMRDLEGLIGTDCTAHPKDFYDKLEALRVKREDLRSSTSALATLADEQYQTVTTLKGTL